MEKTSRHGDNAQSLNAYERKKMLRVQENQAKLRELGVKNVFNSLTSLAENHSAKNKKEKSKDAKEKDPEYVPIFNDENDGDGEEESATSFSAPKKANKRQQYIQPMSMSRYLTKQRVSAPNIIDVSQINVGINDLSRPSMSKITQMRMKDTSSKSQSTSILGQKNGVEHDHSTTRATLGEMILQKNLIRQASSMPNRSSGSRCTLFASNNQDDRQDDMRVEAYDEEDDDEDIDQLMITNGIIEMEGGDNEESIHHDDQSLSSENEDELELEQFEDLHPKKGAKTNDKIRGPTMMHHVHMRPLEKREVIICNEFGQPIGPITSEKDTVGEFSRFLGTIARDYSYAPLIHKSWHKVPHKDKMWEYVLEKYMVPDEAKNLVLRAIGASWRGHKCRVKEKYFYKLKDNKSRWKNRPKQIPDADFMQLLALWNKKEEKIRCSLAKERRKSQKNMHTADPKSFARIYEEMKNTDPNKEPPSLAQMFEQTRKRKEGRIYVDTYDDTAKKVEAMKNYIPPEDGKGSTDPAAGYQDDGAAVKGMASVL